VTRAGAAALLVLVAFRTAHGAEPVPLPLAEALALADRHNPDLAAARARASAQVERAGAAARERWPRLSLAADAYRTDNPARVFAGRLNRGQFGQQDFEIERLNHPPALTHLSSALMLEAPLDPFGRVRSRQRGEEAMGRALEAATAEAVQDLKLGIVEVYQRAALAQATVDFTERTLAAAVAREQDVAARVEQGAALSADLLRVRARRRQREGELAERRAEHGVALAQLARALGTAATEYVPSEVPAAPPALEGSREEWQARAAASRQQMAAGRERAAAARWARTGERRSALPELNAYVQLLDDRGGRGEQSYAAGVSVRWTAFDPARGRRRASAEADVQAAEHEARATVDGVRLEVEAAYLRAASARERHAAAAGGAEEGREALRVIRERRASGMATLTDELETEAASVAAELEELRAAAAAALADAALKRAAGVL
jgi:outer membrane protein TolC